MVTSGRNWPTDPEIDPLTHSFKQICYVIKIEPDNEPNNFETATFPLDPAIFIYIYHKNQPNVGK